jgi:hypothetical protein
LEIYNLGDEFNANDLFNNLLYSNFKLVCNDREIPIHRSIIHQKSEVFASMFQSDEAEVNHMKIDDISGEVVL